MDTNETNVLGGFDAILDSFIPNRETNVDTDIDNNVDDDELEDIKKNQVDPIANKVKTQNKQETDKEDEEEKIESDPETDNDGNIDEPSNTNEDQEDNNLVTNFFDAIAEKLGWEFDEEETDKKPKDVDELISYFQDVIEENSKPEYASKEVEDLDNFVKQGGDIRKYLQIDNEIDLDNIDIEDEDNQKIVIKELLKEKGFNDKKIERMLDRYEEAGLLEDEAQDALDDLKEIKERKKEQLLEELKMQYEQQVQRQQQFYNSVVTEIKGLNNIRGISVPEKDKKALMDYILKPDTDGRTKYQKDYAKGGVKNLIESAYFTMNADKLLEAAKKEGSNSAIDKFRRSLKTNTVSSKSKRINKTNDDSIWFSAARQLRIS